MEQRKQGIKCILAMMDGDEDARLQSLVSNTGSSVKERIVAVFYV